MRMCLIACGTRCQGNTPSKLRVCIAVSSFNGETHGGLAFKTNLVTRAKGNLQWLAMPFSALKWKIPLQPPKLQPQPSPSVCALPILGYGMPQMLRAMTVAMSILSSGLGGKLKVGCHTAASPFD